MDNDTPEIITILASRLDDLEKMIDKIKNKKVPVTFEVVGEPYTIDKLVISKYSTAPLPVKIKVVDVKVAGHYQINGWKFIGKIDHKEAGNILLSSPEEEIPEEYRNSDCKCDHCHTFRDRTETFIIKNMETGEYKQVGRGCLKFYTGGLDAKVCAEICKSIKQVRNFEDELDDDDLIQAMYNSGNYMFSAEIYKAFAYDQIKKYGYDKEDTRYKVTKKISDSKDVNQMLSKYKKDLSDLGTWLETLPDNSYYNNCRIIWESNDLEPYMYNFINSIINEYLKYLQKIKESETVSYVGKIGDRVEFEVESVKVLYTKDGRLYSYYAPDVFVYRILDKQSNIYVWSTSSHVKEGDRIVATIKEHSEYNGEKQNIITRGKII